MRWLPSEHRLRAESFRRGEAVLFVLVVSHALVSVLVVLSPWAGYDWAGGFTGVARVLGGGLFVFVVLAIPIIVGSAVGWAVSAFVLGPRRPRAAWCFGLATGLLVAHQIVAERTADEVFIIGALGQLTAAVLSLRMNAFRAGVEVTT